jgi:hypothetical protein
MSLASVIFALGLAAPEAQAPPAAQTPRPRRRGPEPSAG